jgi:hypothetical protein
MALPCAWWTPACQTCHRFFWLPLPAGICGKTTRSSCLSCLRSQLQPEGLAIIEDFRRQCALSAGPHVVVDDVLPE